MPILVLELSLEMPLNDYFMLVFVTNIVQSVPLLKEMEVIPQLTDVLKIGLGHLHQWKQT